MIVTTEEDLVEHDRELKARVGRAIREHPSIDTREDLAKAMEIDWYAFRAAVERIPSLNKTLLY